MMGKVLSVAALVAGLSSTAVADELMVTRFAEEGDGSVNTFVVDVGGSKVLVDAQRSLSRGQALFEQLEANDERVTAILLTHPHPDHVGGLKALVDGTQAEVFGSSDTSVEVSSDTMGLLELSHRLMPDDTVATPPEPDRIVRDGDALELGERVFTVHEFGPSESLTMTVYAVPEAGVVFPGDLVSPGMTPFLLEKRTGLWLEELDTLEETFAGDTMAYPGHGEPGPLAPMVGEMRGYLTTIRTAVAQSMEDGTFSEEDLKAVVATMDETYKNYPAVAALPQLTARNVIAVAEELSGDPGAPPVSTLEDN